SVESSTGTNGAGIGCTKEWSSGTVGTEGRTGSTGAEGVGTESGDEGDTGTEDGDRNSMK
ncbi:hypothetical protein, partial [Bartonella sp. TT119HLJHH]|uniref:hypothetical protein n=1 Tax=Bartonella sp. TT119HLJHH TaxID=3243579 RepID=UPI0035CEFEE3